jgi:flavin-dependent dehydrogenase
MDRSVDVVVVGGGIAGSALATVLARDGYEVLVLERQTTYRDKVGARCSAAGGSPSCSRWTWRSPCSTRVGTMTR